MCEGKEEEQVVLTCATASASMAPQYCVWFGDDLPCLPGEQSPCRDPDRPDGGSDVTPASALRPGASSARWVPVPARRRRRRRRGRRLVESRRQQIVAIRGILLSLVLGISTRLECIHNICESLALIAL